MVSYRGLAAGCFFGAKKVMTVPVTLAFCAWRRNPREYFAIFDGAEAREADGRWARWELLSCKCVDAYVRLKKNQNQARPCPCSPRRITTALFRLPVSGRCGCCCMEFDFMPVTCMHRAWGTHGQASEARALHACACRRSAGSGASRSAPSRARAPASERSWTPASTAPAASCATSASSGPDLSRPAAWTPPR